MYDLRKIFHNHDETVKVCLELEYRVSDFFVFGNILRATLKLKQKSNKTQKALFFPFFGVVIFENITKIDINFNIDTFFLVEGFGNRKKTDLLRHPKSLIETETTHRKKSSRVCISLV